MANNMTVEQILNSLVAGQEMARARIYGSVAEIPADVRKRIVGTTTKADHPMLTSVAPFAGEFFCDGFRVIRRDVDELINFYVYRTE